MGVDMMKQYCAILSFNQELKPLWPSAVLTAEVHGPFGEGPWSIRAELWDTPHRQDGFVGAWVSFLCDKSPFQQHEHFNIILGKTLVAVCVLDESFASEKPMTKEEIQHRFSIGLLKENFYGNQEI